MPLFYFTSILWLRSADSGRLMRLPSAELFGCEGHLQDSVACEVDAVLPRWTAEGRCSVFKHRMRNNNKLFESYCYIMIMLNTSILRILFHCINIIALTLSNIQIIVYIILFHCLRKLQPSWQTSVHATGQRHPALHLAGRQVVDRGYIGVRTSGSCQVQRCRCNSQEWQHVLRTSNSGGACKVELFMNGLEL